MQNDSLVTVIVPAYNAEKYIVSCLDSICKQSYENIQLIVIDDGSTDDTLQICLDKKKFDDRIKVYHQGNQGPSAARNCGLKHVRGEYLLFVDSDDYLHPDTIRILVDKMDTLNADMCGYGWYDVKNDQKTIHLYSSQEIESQKKEIIKNIMFDDYLNGGGFLWNKIWRISAIKKGSFQEFDVGLRKYEDKLWVLQNITHCERIVFLNVALYYYRIIQNSLSHRSANLQAGRELYQATYKIASFIGSQYPDMKETAYRWSQTYLAGLLFRAVKERSLMLDDRIASRRYKIWELPYGNKAKIHWLIAKISLLLHIGEKNI